MKPYVIVAVLLGGCAAVPLPPSNVALGPAAVTMSACLPPGIPALSTLFQIRQQPGLARETGTGQWVAGRSIFYARSADAITPDYLVYYTSTSVGERIAAVDDHPGTPFPDWVDPGMVTESGELRPDRHATCRWARLVPREHI